MEKKFLSLSKTMQNVVLIVCWSIAILMFVGCSIVKVYLPNAMWLIIILTILGMLFATVSICLTIYKLAGKPIEGQEQQITTNKEEDNK